MPEQQLATDVATLKEQVSQLTKRVDAIDAKLVGSEASQAARHAENSRRLQGIENTLLTHQVERNIAGRVMGWVAKVSIAIAGASAGWLGRDWLPPGGPHHP